MKLSSLSTNLRALCATVLLSFALIACGGSDSSTENSSKDTSETTNTLSKDSIDIYDGNSQDDIRGGHSLLSSYVFGYTSDSIEGFEISDRCKKNSFLRGVFERDSLAHVGYVYIVSGTITLNIGNVNFRRTDNGFINCSSNGGGDRLAVGSVRLTYEVVNNVMTLRLN